MVSYVACCFTTTGEIIGLLGKTCIGFIAPEHAVIGFAACTGVYACVFRRIVVTYRTVDNSTVVLYRTFRRCLYDGVVIE